jgi:hypothetical protein
MCASTTINKHMCLLLAVLLLVGAEQAAKHRHCWDRKRDLQARRDEHRGGDPSGADADPDTVMQDLAIDALPAASAAVNDAGAEWVAKVIQYFEGFMGILTAPSAALNEEDRTRLAAGLGLDASRELAEKQLHEIVSRVSSEVYPHSSVSTVNGGWEGLWHAYTKPAAALTAFRLGRYKVVAERVLDRKSRAKRRKGMMPMVLTARGAADPVQLQAALGSEGRAQLDILLSVTLLRGEAKMFKRHYDRDRNQAEAQGHIPALADVLDDVPAP